VFRLLQVTFSIPFCFGRLRNAAVLNLLPWGLSNDYDFGFRACLHNRFRFVWQVFFTILTNFYFFQNIFQFYFTYQYGIAKEKLLSAKLARFRGYSLSFILDGFLSRKRRAGNKVY
jgi:hypothetical protein